MGEILVEKSRVSPVSLQLLLSDSCQSWKSRSMDQFVAFMSYHDGHVGEQDKLGEG